MLSGPPASPIMTGLPEWQLVFTTPGKFAFFHMLNRPPELLITTDSSKVKLVPSTPGKVVFIEWTSRTACYDRFA